MRDRSFASAAAAGVQAIEAAGVGAATVLSGIDTATGKSYELGSGIALTLIGAGTVVALGVVAVGLFRTLRWSWTPALLIQLFVFIVGVYLLQGHRYDWGGASVALSIVAAVALLLPSSLTAYDRRPTEPPAEPPAAAQKGPGTGKTTTKAGTSKTGTGRTGTGKAGAGQGGSRPRGSSGAR
jgi:hypothetical protein